MGDDDVDVGGRVAMDEMTELVGGAEGGGSFMSGHVRFIVRMMSV